MLGQGLKWWSFTLMSKVTFLSTLKTSLWLWLLLFVDLFALLDVASLDVP
jgi:hypothetical protein